MKVTLLSHTPDAERLVAAAARVCYSDQGIQDILDTISEEHIRKRISDAVGKGHHSVLEHACYTFAVEGVSRVTSHQLVRHRIASFSQQSQRYVKLHDKKAYVIPPRIREDSELRRRFDELVSACCAFYEKAAGSGISAEDARYILPGAFSTSLTVTMNARELLHFFSLRCCKKAQWEIRKVAWRMLREVSLVSPVIFEKAGPACSEGDCPQGDWKCLQKMKRMNSEAEGAQS